MAQEDCLFCKIAAGDIPADRVYEDDSVVVFRDIEPQAPTHLLIIPRKHIVSLAHGKSEDQELFGHMMGLTSKLAEQEQLPDKEFRVVVNAGASAGQTVFHLHIHLLGGRDFSWPPG